MGSSEPWVDPNEMKIGLHSAQGEGILRLFVKVFFLRLESIVVLSKAVVLKVWSSASSSSMGRG